LRPLLLRAFEDAEDLVQLGGPRVVIEQLQGVILGRLGERLGVLVDRQPLTVPGCGAVADVDHGQLRPGDPPVASERRLAAMSVLFEQLLQRMLDGFVDRQRPRPRHLPRHRRSDTVAHPQQRAMARVVFLTTPACQNAQP
jgi:hypothetical protein